MIAKYSLANFLFNVYKLANFKIYFLNFYGLYQGNVQHYCTPLAQFWCDLVFCLSMLNLLLLVKCISTKLTIFKRAYTVAAYISPIYSLSLNVQLKTGLLFIKRCWSVHVWIPLGLASWPAALIGSSMSWLQSGIMSTGRPFCGSEVEGTWCYVI